ncbi:MAG: hypothetical protein AAGH68_06830 [Pseudomonadota bacterium]
MIPDLIFPAAASLSDAVDFATTVYLHHSDRATAYRDERITTLLTVLTAMVASIGFWVSLKSRARLFGVYAISIAGIAIFAMVFQFYWYRYAYTYWAVGEEYRKEAAKLIRDADRTPFPPTTECGDEEVSWELRKDRKVLQKWYREEIDECREMVWGNWSTRQLNFWPVLILLTAGGVILMAWRTRKGPGDTEAKGPDAA